PNLAAARTELKRLGEVSRQEENPGSLAYVGIPKGLAGLIVDIYAAEVADGVTLLPRTADVLGRIVDETLPCLEATGLQLSQRQPDRIREPRLNQLAEHAAPSAERRLREPPPSSRRPSASLGSASRENRAPT